MPETNIIKFAAIIQNRNSATKFLCDKFVKQGNQLHCIRCGHKKYYIQSRERLRCAKCRKDYRPFQNTVLGSIRIDFQKWLVLIKLFKLCISANEAARETGVSYPTALAAYDCMRRAIVKHMAKSDSQLKGEIEADEAYFGGRRKGQRGRAAKNKQIVFGVLERRGKVSIEIVKNVRAKTLLKHTIKKVRMGSMIYTDKFKSYDTLVFHGYKHRSVNHKVIFARGNVHINSLEGFWSFAKERLAKYHGIKSSKFLYYIKEMEWRYNNRNDDLFELLLGYLLGGK